MLSLAEIGVLAAETLASAAQQLEERDDATIEQLALVSIAASLYRMQAPVARTPSYRTDPLDRDYMDLPSAAEQQVSEAERDVYMTTRRLDRD